MKQRLLSLLVCFFVSGFFFLSASQVLASNNVQIGAVGSYNAVIGGSSTSVSLGDYNVGYANLDNDGKTDIILTNYDNPYNVYIILGSSITGDRGQVIDLDDPHSYFLRYTPANSGEGNYFFNSYGSDLDGDGKDEIIIANQLASEGGVDYRGAIYIIYSSLYQPYLGTTGNNLLLSDSANWNIKLMGAAANDNFGASYYAFSDLNNDGRPDLVAAAPYTDYSKTDAGSTYIVLSTLLNPYKTSTGNYLSLSNSATYNYRFDGPETGSLSLSYVFGSTYDYNNDGKDDVIIAAPITEYTEANAGSYYLISQNIFNSLGGTGHTFDLSNSSSYSIRFDSPTNNDSTGYSLITLGDMNNNGKSDLVLTASYASNSPLTKNGDVFLIYDDILDNFSGTGQTASLLDSTSYTMKYTGTYNNSYLGESIWLADYNNDGKLDLVTHDSLHVYVLLNDVFASLTGTGGSHALGTDGTYSYLFTKPPHNFISTYNLSDVNGDGTWDFILTSVDEAFLSRTDSGANYIVLNFPHHFNLNSSSAQMTGSTQTVAGTINNPNSTTAIQGVQYLVDHNNPDNPNWQSCSAVDGAFDSTSEMFTCSLSGLSLGNHTVYLRAYDEKATYTAPNHYAQFALYGPTINSSGSAGNTPQPPSCTALSPSGIPNLFQITTERNAATVYFAPVSNNTSSYYIRYGTAPGQLVNGDEFAESSSQGVLSRKIQALQPKTTYYFQVRAGNGCATGQWGNVLKATTTSNKKQFKKFFSFIK